MFLPCQGLRVIPELPEWNIARISETRQQMFCICTNFGIVPPKNDAPSMLRIAQSPSDPPFLSKLLTQSQKKDNAKAKTGRFSYLLREIYPMGDRSSKQSDLPATAAALVAGLRLTPQMLIMFRAILGSRQRTKLLLLGVAIVAVIVATAFGQVRLNVWNQPFYDALAHKDLRGLLDQLMVFGVIAGGLLVLNVAQVWLNQTTKVKLREWLVCDLFDEWLKPRRAFHLVNAGEMGTNPDQRIHEDARHLTELTTDLGIGLLQSSLLLGSFIGVLWILSQNVTFHVSGRSFGIPGYMVWCALLYAGTASWLSWPSFLKLSSFIALQLIFGGRASQRPLVDSRTTPARQVLTNLEHMPDVNCSCAGPVPTIG
jgi:ABC transporter transmembrane region 2